MLTEALLRPEAAAARIGCSIEELIEFVETGRVSCVWVGRQRRFFPNELEVAEAVPQPESESETEAETAPKPRWSEFDVSVERAVAACIEASGIEAGRPAVYVVQAGPNGPIKVGFVRRVGTLRDRLRSLQAGCPFQLVPLLLIPGGVYVESEYHGLLACYRIRGEWFERAALAVLERKREPS